MEDKCEAQKSGIGTWKLADGILLQRPVEQSLISVQAVGFQLVILRDSLSTACTQRVMRMNFPHVSGVREKFVSMSLGRTCR